MNLVGRDRAFTNQDQRFACAWRRRLIGIAVALAALAAPPAGAKSTFDGAGMLATSDEVDHWAIGAPAGATISIVITKATSMLVDLSLNDGSSGFNEPLSSKTPAEAASIKYDKILVPATGKYDLQVHAVSGVGAYKVMVSVKLPKNFLTMVSTEGQVQPGTDISIDVVPATLLDITVTYPDKPDPGIAAPITLTGPSGGVSFDSHASWKGKKFRVSGLPIAAFGPLTMSVVDNQTSLPTKIRYKRRKPHLPKPPTLIEGADPLVVAALSGLSKSINNKQALAFLGTAIEDAAALPEDDMPAAYAVLLQSFVNFAGQPADKGLLDELGPKLFAAGSPGGASSLKATTCSRKATIIFVNGVYTSVLEANFSAALLEKKAGPVLGGIPHIEPSFEVFWNPSGKDTTDLQKCLLNVELNVLAALAAVPEFAVAFPPWALGMAVAPMVGCAAVSLAGNAVSFAWDLLVESPVSWLLQFSTANVPPDVAGELAERVEDDLGDDDFVILVGHSQGNFVIDEALALLTSDERERVAVLGLASPTLYPLDQGATTKKLLTLHNDIIANLVPFGAPYPTPGFTNKAADSAAAICSASPLSLECIAAQKFVHGIGLSYLGQDQSAQFILERLVQLVNHLIDINGPLPCEDSSLFCGLPAAMYNRYCEVGDVTGDGLDDIIDVYMTGPLVQEFKVALLAAPSFAAQWTKTVPMPPAEGYTFAEAAGLRSDLTGDGRGDVIVADSAAGVKGGRRWLISGATGDVVWTSTDTSWEVDEFALSISQEFLRLADIDGKGLPDFAVGSDVVSSETGSALFHAPGPVYATSPPSGGSVEKAFVLAGPGGVPWSPAQQKFIDWLPADGACLANYVKYSHFIILPAQNENVLAWGADLSNAVILDAVSLCEIQAVGAQLGPNMGAGMTQDLDGDNQADLVLWTKTAPLLMGVASSATLKWIEHIPLVMWPSVMVGDITGDGARDGLKKDDEGGSTCDIEVIGVLGKP